MAEKAAGGGLAERPGCLTGKECRRERRPGDLTGKIAAEDAGQSAERHMSRLAGRIRPLAIGHAEGRHGDGSGMKPGRGRKEAWAGA